MESMRKGDQMDNHYGSLFKSIRIGNCEIKNRYAMAPMGPAGLVDSDGAFTKEAIDFYAERARHDVGLIITGMCFSENAVEKHSPGTMPCPTQNAILFTRTARLLTERVHAWDAKIFLQLSGGFGRVASRIPERESLIAPSEVPAMWAPEHICRAVSSDEIAAITAGIAKSAAIAKKAGFDGVEIHAMHEGYLIDQFALACTNRRADRYGGSLENRVRFAAEIREAIAETCGAEFPAVMRFSVKSFMKGFNRGALPGEIFSEYGRDVSESLEIAKLLEKAGYDALDADVGSYDAWYWSHPPMYQEKGLYLKYSEELKQVVSIPVLTAGRMDDPETALSAIENGQTDMVALARPLLADPEIVRKIRRGETARIRPCLSCQEGCIGRLKAFMHVSCAVNPATGREAEYALKQARNSKRIAVIGGGVAGCEAARVLAMRGHDVSLYEREKALGGHLIPGGAPDFKSDDRALVRWYKRELKALGVPIYLNRPITDPVVEMADADAVIVATGSKPKLFKPEGPLPALSAQDVLTGDSDPGSETVILGGGLVGCELALNLVRRGVRATVVEQENELMMHGGPLCFANKQMLVDLLDFHGVRVMTSSRLVRTETDGVFVCGADRAEQKIPTESLILAIGYMPESSLYAALKTSGKDVYLIGDARKTGNIMYAVLDANEVARFI
jgi:2-enoate reductase